MSVMEAIAHLDDRAGLIDLNTIEGFMLKHEQAQCPVVHHFGPGIYMREVSLKAGSYAIGHEQRYSQLNVMLTGKVALVVDESTVKVVQAPTIYVGPPGRKIGYIIEDTVWLNVYSTDETDIDKLEEMFLIKSDVWKDHEQKEDRSFDRSDFFSVLDEYGFTPEEVHDTSTFEGDQIPMPHGAGLKLTVRDSDIHGKGIFLTYPAKAGEILAPARIGGMRTPAGRYTNHSANPNAMFMKDPIGNISLVALRDINGCVGGSKGEEITVDYRQALEVNGVKKESGK